MGQDPLSEQQKVMTDLASDMSPADQAAHWADSLIRKYHRGPGDTLDAAMHRVSVKHGIEHQTLWRLRYRRPKDLLASIYLKIRTAYETECDRQEAKLRHELEITKALPRSPAGDRLIAQTEAFLASLDQHATAETANRTD